MAVDAPRKRLVIHVRDTGMGIAPDMLTRIFEIFVQTRDAQGRSQGGLGIGLNLDPHWEGVVLPFSRNAPMVLCNAPFTQSSTGSSSLMLKPTTVAPLSKTKRIVPKMSAG